jgi:hypothetical protein
MQLEKFFIRTNESSPLMDANEKDVKPAGYVLPPLCYYQTVVWW